jgi:hypothetical protein
MHQFIAEFITLYAYCIIAVLVLLQLATHPASLPQYCTTVITILVQQQPLDRK